MGESLGFMAPGLLFGLELILERVNRPVKYPVLSQGTLMFVLLGICASFVCRQHVKGVHVDAA